MSTRPATPASSPARRQARRAIPPRPTPIHALGAGGSLVKAALLGLCQPRTLTERQRRGHGEHSSRVDGVSRPYENKQSAGRYGPHKHGHLPEDTSAGTTCCRRQQRWHRNVQPMCHTDGDRGGICTDKTGTLAVLAVPRSAVSTYCVSICGATMWLGREYWRRSV